ncbi:MAG: hypothetical protein H6672_07840 [Anaerolineaceae bacterium]|nr:hypothetical protein [Anaerolineaceae bacterium]
MSKRKNRKANSPNLPDSVLERARQQLNEENGEEVAAVPETPAAAPTPAPAPKRAAAAPARASRPKSSRSGRDAQPARAASRKTDTSDHAYILQRLAHPTRVVTIDELRSEYAYVVKDLRSMGLLAAGLLIALAIMAQILPK